MCDKFSFTHLIIDKIFFFYRIGCNCIVGRVIINAYFGDIWFDCCDEEKHNSFNNFCYHFIASHNSGANDNSEFI
jgi:hypothetical protein